MTAVTVVSPDDRDRAIETITLALASDRVVRGVPDDHCYAEYCPRIVEALAGRALRPRCRL